MRRPLGFIQLSLLGWAAVAAGAVILSLSAALWFQTARLDAANAKLEAARVLAEAQELKAREQQKLDKQRKEKADADHKRAIARLAADNRRLRDAQRASVLPAPSPTAASTDRICFSRSGLDAALREFLGEAAGIAWEGDACRVGLDTAKAWAQGR